MKSFAPAACFIALALILAGCGQTKVARKTTSPANSQATEASLLPEEEAPLLLDEGLDFGLPAEGGADNSRCAVCHLNLIREELALTHAQADMGCADCHGPSDAHIADESWASGGNGTAPDTMFPKDRINPACLECHPREDLPSEEHDDLFAGRSEEKYCTECHGEHLLVKRTCRWK